MEEFVQISLERYETLKDHNSAIEVKDEMIKNLKLVIVNMAECTSADIDKGFQFYSNHPNFRYEMAIRNNDLKIMLRKKP